MTRSRFAWGLWVAGAALLLYVFGVIGRTLGWVGVGAGLIGSIVAWGTERGAGAPRRERAPTADRAAATPEPAARRPLPPLPPVQQAAAIPFRRSDGGVEICLIRRRTRSWGIPKGGVERGEALEYAARREAWEEAGIKGRAIGAAIGSYEYRRGDTHFVVAVFLLEVIEERSAWHESAIRERRWVTPAAAAEMLSDHPALSLFERAADLLAGNGPV
jgi:8-oxo-dGTP pyrophosphatase MutT (NUDIX family)